MLLTSLGLAIGFSTTENLWRTDTETAADFMTGVGIWTAISFLLGFFVAGMVSTKVTDRPDRGGALLHGTITWVLLSLFLPWLISSGMSHVTGIGASPDVGVTPEELIPAPASLTVAELSDNLGLDDPDHVSTQLADPRAPLILAASTGVSVTEAQTAISDLQTRITSLQGDPSAVNDEVSSFLSRMVERARENAPQVAVHTEQDAEVGSWMLFGVMAVTLVVSIMGAFAGIPDRRRWRMLLARP
jgi:hypothetical protein